MKIKGKIIFNKQTGKELGVVTRATPLHVYVGTARYPRDIIIPIKKSKRSRKGKAPSPETQDKRDRRDDHLIQLDLPAFLKREEGEKHTESCIQFNTYGCKPGSKMWNSASRAFNTVTEAQEYLKEFIKSEKIIYSPEKKTYAKLEPSGRGISSNHPLPDTLKGKAPTGLLINIISDQNTRSITMIKKTTKKVAEKTDTSSNMVVLKKICQELKIDPRKARMKLRKSIGPATDGRWEWPEGSKELKQVREILSPKE